MDNIKDINKRLDKNGRKFLKVYCKGCINMIVDNFFNDSNYLYAIILNDNNPYAIALPTLGSGCKPVVFGNLQYYCRQKALNYIKSLYKQRFSLTIRMQDKINSLAGYYKQNILEKLR